MIGPSRQTSPITTMVADNDNLVADHNRLVAPNPALPRWQQIMQDSSAPLDDSSEDDAAPVPADAPPRGSTDSPAGQGIMSGDREELRSQLEEIWKKQFLAECQRMTRPTSRSRSVPHYTISVRRISLRLPHHYRQYMLSWFSGPHYGDHPRFLHGKLSHGVSRKTASPGTNLRTRYSL